MMIKRIQADTLENALERVRETCGEDALLIETRRTRSGYLLIAACTEHLVDRATSGIRASANGCPRWTRGFAPLAQTAMAFGLSSTPLRAVEKALIGTRVDLSAPGDPAIADVAARILKALIRTESMTSGRHRVCALVGPTGVGKTTTLAKLAARAVRDAGQSVAILTTDTYRIAAVEQLRAFAEMLGAPFEVAFTPMDLRRSVQRFCRMDRIFIDTTGRSPYDANSIAALEGTLNAARPGIALCLAAGTRRRDGIAVLNGFEALAPDCMILTKWDETEAPGEALSLAIEGGMPLAHVTVGQEVPLDIVPANALQLARVAFELAPKIAPAPETVHPQRAQQPS